MNFINHIKKYSFHIIAICTFFFFSFYKFIPFVSSKSINNDSIDNSSEYSVDTYYKSLCTDYINDNFEEFFSLVYNRVEEKCDSESNCLIDNGNLLFGTNKNDDIKRTSVDSNSETQLLYIDLSGAVNKPGVYSLKKGSRITDLINLGKGFTENASSLWISRNLNLSSELYDMQKVYVPYKWETYGNCECIIEDLYISAPLLEDYSSNNNNYLSNKNSDTKEGSSIDKNNSSTIISNSTNSDVDNSILADNDISLINVNNANLELLDSLSGIGPAYAQKIIDNRPYSDIQDFINNSNIPSSTISKISQEITF